MKKIATGIDGFDKVTNGGLPASRPTLIAGGPGCGKSLFAMTCAAHVASTSGDGAVFLSFEEQPDDIVVNARSIGLELTPLLNQGKLLIDYIEPPEQNVMEIGSYTLDGLLVRIASLAKEANAKLFAIDTIETLFTMFENVSIIRSELLRMFRWFKHQGITLLVTGEQGDGSLTRYGLEEYVSDCVIFLDHRVDMDISTRRLRIVKYRGAKHGTNEFPFVIESDGIHVVPITVAQLDHCVPDGFISTGLDRLDQALGDDGFNKGSTVLISGVTGSGKTNMAMSIGAAAAARGHRTVFFSFEESPDELIRNVASIGLDITPYIEQQILSLHCARPTLQGLEQHLVEMYRVIEKNKPAIVVVDPLSGLKSAGIEQAVYRMMVRLVDILKQKQITLLATASQREHEEDTGLDISAIIDVWFHLRRCSADSPFEKTLEVTKARGRNHERGLIGYAITSEGIRFDSPLADVGLGATVDV